MFIREISLNNFRIYKGQHTIAFEKDVDRNIYIISGNNGYGKTSFLTSLIWCLYGKNMQEVDDSFARQIKDMGGYRKYILSCFNLIAHTAGETAMSMKITFSDITVPGFTCNEVSIVRSYFIDREHEDVEILIDGKPNELIEEVGKEIFIHDFILPKEIAKFFFFDAEKNVSLAEAKSINDRANLSKAYSEILGIKKYEDLRSHLSDLRLRYRKSSADKGDADKIRNMEVDIDHLQQFIQKQNEKITEHTATREELKLKSDQLQAKLIREGSSVTVEKVKDLQQRKRDIQKAYEQLKEEFVRLMELAPFAIAGKQMAQLEEQLLNEQKIKQRQLPASVINRKVPEIIQALQASELNDKIQPQSRKHYYSRLQELLKDQLLGNDQSDKAKLHHDLTKEQYEQFRVIMHDLRNSFRTNWDSVTKAIRQNRSEYNRITKRLQEAESKENDKLIQSYRDDKIEMDTKAEELSTAILNLTKEISVAEHQYASKKKVLEELTKRVTLDKQYKEKDDKAAKLIEELDRFIVRIKNEKRHSLEERIKTSLDVLMHKKQFVTKVEVLIEHDVLDIKLYNKKTEIVKDNLSKGEQQLYATALLKALVEESGIDFPVFVDSPMQKYDVEHAANIISEFYPTISKQVVLFPLLKKEINKEEYKLLSPFVKQVYMIENDASMGSSIRSIKASELFNEREVSYAG